MDHRERLLAEWQTKTVATFIAATVPTAKGKKNTLLESAHKISLFPQAKADNRGREPAAGSFEKLMLMAGSLSKPR